LHEAQYSKKDGGERIGEGKGRLREEGKRGGKEEGVKTAAALMYIPSNMP